MSRKAKSPSLKMKVLHVSGAGRKVVQVTPQGQRITIGRDSWNYRPRDHRWPGKGSWEAVAVEGRDSCLSPWEATVLTSEAYNADVENNLLEQVHSLSPGGRKEKIHWINAGINVLLVLAILFMGFKVSGDIEDHDRAMEVLVKSMQGPEQDVIVVGGDQQNGRNGAGPQDLGRLQQQEQPEG